MFEFRCRDCDESAVRYIPFAKVDEQFCDWCGAQLDLQVSVPAPVRVGKYGKGGGISGQ
jgi:hypothetical protein